MKKITLDCCISLEMNYIKKFPKHYPDQTKIDLKLIKIQNNLKILQYLRSFPYTKGSFLQSIKIFKNLLIID